MTNADKVLFLREVKATINKMAGIDVNKVLDNMIDAYSVCAKVDAKNEYFDYSGDTLDASGEQIKKVTPVLESWESEVF